MMNRYVWGGMQYQLEHHLFPTMPRYKYRQLVPLVRKFAEENGIKYRATGQWEIIKDNIKLVSACYVRRSTPIRSPIERRAVCTAYTAFFMPCRSFTARRFVARDFRDGGTDQ